MIGAAGLSGGAWFYTQNANLLPIFLSAAPPFVISAIAFTWLGLTEKSRRKMNADSEKRWVEYYFNPQQMHLRGSISGTLWIFSFAAFFIVAFTWGWKFSWIVFVVAVGLEILIEAFFVSRNLPTINKSPKN